MFVHNVTVFAQRDKVIQEYKEIFATPSGSVYLDSTICVLSQVREVDDVYIVVIVVVLCLYCCYCCCFVLVLSLQSANLMNTALQAVYQSKGNVPTPTNSSTGDGSLPCSTSERAQFDSLGSDYPNQTGEPSCEATSTNGHPVLEGHRTTTAVLQGKGTPLSTAVRTGMEEGPFEEVVPVEGSLSESPLQQTVLDKRTAIATPQLPASHVTSIRGNSPRTSLGTLPVGTPGDFAGNSPLNLSMSGFNEQETPTAKEGLVQSCSSLLKSEDQRNSSIICSSRKRLVEEGDKDGADSKIRQKRKKIKDPIVAGQSVGKASSERPQDPGLCSLLCPLSCTYAAGLMLSFLRKYTLPFLSV